MAGFRQVSIHDLRVNAAQLRQDVLSVTSDGLSDFSSTAHTHETTRYSCKWLLAPFWLGMLSQAPLRRGLQSQLT